MADGYKSNFSRLRDSGKENSVRPTRQKNIITAQFCPIYLLFVPPKIVDNTFGLNPCPSLTEVDFFGVFFYLMTVMIS